MLRVFRVEANGAEKELFAGHGDVGLCEAQVLHGCVEVVSTNEMIEVVCGGVVADDDHEHGQVAQCGLQAEGHFFEDAGAGYVQVFCEFDAMIQGEPSFVHLAVEFYKERDFEGAGGEENFFGIVVNLAAGFQVFDRKADDSGDVGNGGFEVGHGGVPVMRWRGSGARLYGCGLRFLKRKAQCVSSVAG